MSSEQLDRIEEKVDGLIGDLRQYAERTAKNEESINWIKRVGSAILTIILTACGWLYQNKHH